MGLVGVQADSERKKNNKNLFRLQNEREPMDLNNWTRMRLLQKVDFDSASLAGDGVLVVVQECGTVVVVNK